MFQRAAVRTAAAATAVAAVVAVGTVSYSTNSGSLPGAITVQAGDSLWNIAIAHGVTVPQLAAANGMSPNDILPIGKQLRIPTPGAPAAPAKPATAKAAAAANTLPSAASFCSASFYQGPWGQVPSLLAQSPDRLALRPVMVQWANTYGVAPGLVEAIAWQESGWQQNVVSAAGAVGIGQLLPATANFVQNDLVGTRLNIKSANDNIRMEAAFLAYLIRVVGNNPCTVAAAYYEGPAALASVGVYPDTEQYVRDILALEPEFY